MVECQALTGVSRHHNIMIPVHLRFLSINQMEAVDYWISRLPGGRRFAYGPANFQILISGEI